MTMPESNKIYTKAVLHECNYTLKWQDSDGNIYYYPTYTADATQYNTGVERNGNILETGYIQLMSWISLDDVTKEINAIKNALNAGEASYTLQYSVKCKQNLLRTIED